MHFKETIRAGFLTVIGFFCLFGSTRAHAEASSNYSITGTAGVGSLETQGHTALQQIYGLKLGWNLNGEGLADSTGIEAIYNYLHGTDGRDAFEVRLDYLFPFAPKERLVPFVAVGAGGISIHGDTGLVLAVGGGVEYFLDDHLALRGDLRGSLVGLQGAGVKNAEFTVGVSYHFGKQLELSPVKVIPPAPAPAGGETPAPPAAIPEKGKKPESNEPDELDDRLPAPAPAPEKKGAPEDSGASTAPSPEKAAAAESGSVPAAPSGNTAPGDSSSPLSKPAPQASKTGEPESEVQKAEPQVAASASPKTSQEPSLLPASATAPVTAEAPLSTSAAAPPSTSAAAPVTELAAPASAAEKMPASASATAPASVSATAPAPAEAPASASAAAPPSASAAAPVTEPAAPASAAEKVPAPASEPTSVSASAASQEAAPSQTAATAEVSPQPAETVAAAPEATSRSVAPAAKDALSNSTETSACSENAPVPCGKAPAADGEAAGPANPSKEVKLSSNSRPDEHEPSLSLVHEVKTALMISFGIGKSNVPTESYPQLQQIAQLAKSDPKLQIVIAGHTDDLGGSHGNYLLSLKRARSVRDYLVKVLKVDQRRITAKGFGRYLPLSNQKSAEERRRSRRTIVIVF